MCFSSAFAVSDPFLLHITSDNIPKHQPQWDYITILNSFHLLLIVLMIIFLLFLHNLNSKEHSIQWGKFFVLYNVGGTRNGYGMRRKKLLSRAWMIFSCIMLFVLMFPCSHSTTILVSTNVAMVRILSWR